LVPIDFKALLNKFRPGVGSLVSLGETVQSFFHLLLSKLRPLPPPEYLLDCDSGKTVSTAPQFSGHATNAGLPQRQQSGYLLACQFLLTDARQQSRLVAFVKSGMSDLN